MKIVEVKELKIPEVKIVKFGRFPDSRGYFNEIFRQSDFDTKPELSFLKDVRFFQFNESFSKSGVVRGLHFQWDPFMGKFVRTVFGRMIDIVLDIRKGSPTFGKILMYDMPVNETSDFSQWIWVPKGFAHGNIFTEKTVIEYFCTAEYSPKTEAGISPLSKDIDWSLCDPALKKLFFSYTEKNPLISEKDKEGLSLSQWENDTRSEKFVYGK